MSSTKTAFTLIEVVVSLALMGTLLVSALIAYGQTIRQTAVGSAKIEAVQIADDLIEGWVLGSVSAPDVKMARCPGNERYRFSTQKILAADEIYKIKLDLSLIHI